MSLQQYHLNNANTKQTRELIEHIDKSLIKALICDELEALLDEAHTMLICEGEERFVYNQKDRLEKIKELYERRLL